MNSKILSAKPKLPFRTHLFNALGNRSLREITPSSLENTATSELNLFDFGDPHYREGLKKLCETMDNNHLSYMGRENFKYTMELFLKNRLLINAAKKKKPEIFSTDLIHEPLIILGLPRTGTTFLHKLLALDSNNKALPLWELLRPVSPQMLKKNANDNRREITDKDIQDSAKYTLSLDHIHYIRADSYEECMWIFGSTFLSWAYWITMPVYNYQQWYHQQNLDKKYSEYFEFLQLLQNKYNSNRFLLKSPSHTGGISNLLQTIPNAMIIQTHRDPIEVANSFNSLVYWSHSLTSKKIDVARMVEENLQLLEIEIKKNLTARQSHENAIYDVSYKNFIQKPIATIKAIYKHFSLDWTREFEGKLTAYINLNQKNKHGKHTYRASDFGYTEKSIINRFQQYNDWLQKKFK